MEKEPEVQPQFMEGTQVDKLSLVVDENHVAWWIDPNNKKIEKAVASTS